MVHLYLSLGDEIKGVVLSCRYFSSLKHIDVIWRAPSRYIAIPMLLHLFPFDITLCVCCFLFDFVANYGNNLKQQGAQGYQQGEQG
jgi:hypothetical protein